MKTEIFLKLVGILHISAVGVDNVFILLSAWRATPTNESMERRMHETFADAAVSITVTSLTDLISFAVGCATPFPSVQVRQHIQTG